jgi:glucan phosphoethanolaminetransferase (alkaline phosphatase superfamily)
MLVPNIFLLSVRFINGNFYLAIKSLFYLFISLYFFLLPVLFFPTLKIKVYAFLLYFYLLIVPLIVFAVLLYAQWPTKFVVNVIISANKQEIKEFLGGMWMLKIFLLLYYIFSFWLIVVLQPPKVNLSVNIRKLLLGSFVLLFLVFGTYKSFQRGNFSLFSLHTLKRFVKETPVSLVIRSWKSIQLHHKTGQSDFIPAHNFNSTRKIDSDTKEIYVLVIGESSRYDHWHKNGYNRQTSPNVDTIRNLVSFENVYSNSELTYISVPFMLGYSIASTASKSPESMPVLIDYFNSAGFETWWISNQHNQFNTIGSIAGRSNHYITTDCKKNMCYDNKLLDELQMAIFSKTNKLFVVIHQLGSHYPYHNRYPEDFKRFTPDLKANKHIIYRNRNREKLINSYDNSILYTDYILGQVIENVRKQNCVSSVIYCSDHGEFLFEDSSQGYGRGLEGNSFSPLHVPLFIWVSDEFASEYPDKFLNLRYNKAKPSTLNNVFHSMLHMADFQIDSIDLDMSLFEAAYNSDDF